MAVTVSPLAQAAFARLATGDAPVFTPGQLLEALVLGKLPDGFTALRIGDVTVSAQLPQSLPPGTNLQLQVTTGGASPQLTIVAQPATPMPAQPLPMPAPLPPLVDMPVVLQPTPTAPPPTPSSPTPMPAPVLAAAPVIVAAVAQQAAPPAPANVESRQPVAATPAATTSTPAAPAAGQGTPAPVAAPAAIIAAPASGSAPPQAAPVSNAAPTPTAPVTTPTAALPPTVAAPLPVPTPPSTVPSVPPAPVAAPPATVPPPPAAPAPPPVTTTTPAPAPVAIPAAAAQPAIVPTPPPTPVPVTTQQAPVVAVPMASADADLASPLLVAQGAARPAASMADLPKLPLPTATAAPATTAPAQPATPQAALAQMVPEALAKQNALGPLLLSLASAATKAGAMPEPVLRAAMQVLAQRVTIPPNGPTADLLKAAIAKSGIYLEAGLAKGAAPAGDMKAALAGLKGALGAWLGGNPAPVQATQQAAPPLRGMPPRADAMEPAPLPPLPQEAGRALHSQADAALSRLKLMQFASLPDADPATRHVPPEVRMDLPFLIGSELVMAQFQIFRDGARQRAEQKRGWTMRFAMNFSGTGEVGAEIGLLGRSVNVALWAAERDTAEALNAALPELAPALARLGLDAGSIRVRSLPPAAEKPVSGHFLDSVS